MQQRLFLIPNILSDDNQDDFIPDHVRKAVHHLRHFVVENEKSARALIKKLKLAASQQELIITLWNEHSRKEDLREVVESIGSSDAGIISEAGLPCVADPGKDIVAWAHSRNIQVVPLPGPSSILLALMASGLNGQSFTFHGYLPIDKAHRIRRIKELEQLAQKGQAQIFMEAPYRNNQLLEDLIKNGSAGTRLCIARNLTSAQEMVSTKPLSQWAKDKPDLHKQPVIFILA